MTSKFPTSNTPLESRLKISIGFVNLPVQFVTYVLLNIGKKRVQCNVCLKTFCDMGAQKIHFSAVHLRVMHTCGVEGEFKYKLQRVSCSNCLKGIHCARFFPIIISY